MQSAALPSVVVDQGSPREWLENATRDTAGARPGPVSEVLPRESAAPWIRPRLAAAAPSKPWLETKGECAGRLRRLMGDIGANLDVDR